MNNGELAIRNEDLAECEEIIRPARYMSPPHY